MVAKQGKITSVTVIRDVTKGQEEEQPEEETAATQYLQD